MIIPSHVNKFRHKLTRLLIISLLVAVTFPILMATPNAYASDKFSPNSNGQHEHLLERTEPQKHTHRANTNRREEPNNDDSHHRNNGQNTSAHKRHDRPHRRDLQPRDNRYWNHEHRHGHNYRPYWNFRRNTKWNNHYNGYKTSYRSSLGISFIFGQPDYSRYRWAPTRYSYYQPGYMSYTTYQSNTSCQRVVIDGFHQGHNEQVSVLECSNPYDGTYIVQGTEQIIDCYGGSNYNNTYTRR